MAAADAVEAVGGGAGAEAEEGPLAFPCPWEVEEAWGGRAEAAAPGLECELPWLPGSEVVGKWSCTWERVGGWG